MDYLYFRVGKQHADIESCKVLVERRGNTHVIFEMNILPSDERKAKVTISEL